MVSGGGSPNELNCPSISEIFDWLSDTVVSHWDTLSFWVVTSVFKACFVSSLSNFIFSSNLFSKSTNLEIVVSISLISSFSGFWMLITIFCGIFPIFG